MCYNGGLGRRISAITAAVRDQNRCNIFIDGEFVCSLTMAQVVELGVKVGQEISTEREAELLKMSGFGKLYQRTLEWLLAKPRSVKETRDFLERKRRMREIKHKQKEGCDKRGAVFERETAERVVERLVERGYLDDEKFAAFFVENRDRRKGTSQRKLQIELRQKGVSEEVIARALAENPRDEAAEIAKIIAKKGDKYSDIKLYQYLLRRGFDPERVRAALAERD